MKNALKLLLAIGLSFACDFDEEMNCYILFEQGLHSTIGEAQKIASEFRDFLKDNKEENPYALLYFMVNFSSAIVRHFNLHSMCSEKLSTLEKLVNDDPKLKKEINKFKDKIHPYYTFISDTFGHTKILWALDLMYANEIKKLITKIESSPEAKDSKDLIAKLKSFLPILRNNAVKPTLGFIKICNAMIKGEPSEEPKYAIAMSAYASSGDFGTQETGGTQNKPTKTQKRRAKQKARKEERNKEEEIFKEAQEQNLLECQKDTSSSTEKMLGQFIPEYTTTYTTKEINGKEMKIPEIQVKLPVDHPNIHSFFLRTVGSSEKVMKDRLIEYALESFNKINELIEEAKKDDRISLLHLHRLLALEFSAKFPNENYRIMYHTGRPFPNPNPVEGSCHACEFENEKEKFVAMFHGHEVKIKFEPNVFYEHLAQTEKRVKVYSEIRKFLLDSLKANKSIEDILKSIPLDGLEDLGKSISFVVYSKDIVTGHYSIKKEDESIAFLTRLKIPPLGCLDFSSDNKPLIFKPDAGETIGNALRTMRRLDTKITTKNIIDTLDKLSTEVHSDLELIKNPTENMKIIFIPAGREYCNLVPGQEILT